MFRPSSEGYIFTNMNGNHFTLLPRARRALCKALFEVHRYAMLSKIIHRLIIKIYGLKSLSKILYNEYSLSLIFILCHIAVLVVLSTSFIQVLLVGECLKLFTM
jgi:hypothetical protein